MVAFYKHDIPAWMDGTESLSDGAYRAYHVICQLIYLHEGPIALNERGLAGRCNQSLRAFAKNLRELVESGKLTVENGRIFNSRAEKELESVRTNRENARVGGQKSGEARKPPPNPLKNNDQVEAPLQEDRSLKEKRREEKSREDSPLNPPLDALPLELPPHPPDEGLKAAVGRKGGASRGSRLPSGWTLSAEGRAYATAKGLSNGRIEREAERFRDFWLAKTGKDAVKADWEATWRNWVLRVVDRGDLTLGQTAPAAPVARYYDN